MRKKDTIILSAVFCISALTASCSMTSGLPEGETLYRGIEEINYSETQNDSHYVMMREEMEAALACMPNGSFFGSSSYTSPFQYRLWIWNATAHKNGAVAKWLARTFGKAPVTMSEVNPPLRINVAEAVLQNNGFFRSKIDYSLIDGKTGITREDSVPHVLTQKVRYDVELGPLYTIDTLEYIGFTEKEKEIFKPAKTLLKKGAPFSVETLDRERTRITDSLRNNGYYLFKNTYLKYLADTIQRPGKVMIRLCKADSLPEGVEKQWYIGKTVLRVRREIREAITDTFARGRLSVEYGGKKPPLRPRILLQDIKLRTRRLFSQSLLDESLSQLTSKGIFSSLDIQTEEYGDSLKLVVDCILDKPYDISLMANYTHKTSGRGGPGIGVGFTKRNAFRNGEILCLNLNSSMDFTIGKTAGGTDMNYDLSADVSLEMPRILKPSFIKMRRRWEYSPNTIIRLSAQTINRTGFFRRNIFSGEMLYNFYPTRTSRHTFSPLSLDYSYLASIDDEYMEFIQQSPYLILSHNDVFIPKMRYSYSFNKKYADETTMGASFTVTEAGNLTNLIYTLAGKGWNEKEKNILKTPFSQFLKFEAEYKKEWKTDLYSKVVFHAFGGYVHPLGNSAYVPFSERYYMGGANDLRGFPTRGVGPGSVYTDNRDAMYIISNGNLKLKTSVEYRPRIFGSLYGAVFADAGNTWNVGSDYGNIGGVRMRSFFKDIAVSAGAGIRYDLDFFVIRLDWGFIIHAPYDTGKSGYFNTPRFSKAQCLNFAIGYPF